ncbi:MAG: DUF3656 domain-containing protein [Planctomycetaceae bacterium]
MDEVVSRGIVELEFGENAIDYTRLTAGQAVWKTDDPQLTRRVQTFMDADPDPARRGRCRRSRGNRPSIGDFRADRPWSSGERCFVEPLAAARTRPATAEFFREQLGRLGHTVYELRQVSAEIVGEPMVPLSVLSDLRRKLIEELNRQSARPPSRQIARQTALAGLRAAISVPTTASPNDVPRLRILCRDLAQLRTVAALKVTGLYADFQDIRDYREAVNVCRQAETPLFLAPPRIQKPGEFGIFAALAKAKPDGVLVRNLSGLRFCRDHDLPAIADYSLNVTNELTADLLIRQGAARITASYDLNRDQLLELTAAVPPAWLEVVIHQHMPLFHMEHCVFCAVLSPGTNKTNCGRPCDRHLVQLRDRVGMEHPLKADVGCRNTLYNAVPQSGADVVAELQQRGLRDFRIELLDETPDEVRRTVELYQLLLAGQKPSEEIWRELRAMNRVGVTRGTLEERRNPLAIL